MKDAAKEIANIIDAFKQDGKYANDNRKLFESVHNH